MHVRKDYVLCFAVWRYNALALTTVPLMILLQITLVKFLSRFERDQIPKYERWRLWYGGQKAWIHEIKADDGWQGHLGRLLWHEMFWGWKPQMFHTYLAAIGDCVWGYGYGSKIWVSTSYTPPIWRAGYPILVGWHFDCDTCLASRWGGFDTGLHTGIHYSCKDAPSDPSPRVSSHKFR